MLAETQLEDAEWKALYYVIAGKGRSKTCCKCGRSHMAHEGDYIWTDGDMSKPKQFRCYYCKERNL